MERRECFLEELANRNKIFRENEYVDDIVFARYINYMRTALLNRKINFLKHKKYLLEKEIFITNEEWESLSKEDNFEHSFFYEDLRIAIEKLTEKERKVVILYYYQNKKIKEIAKALNMSEKAVKQLKLRIITKLRKYLEEIDEK